MGKINFRIILPVLVVISFAVLVVDAVKGPGSFAKHFFVDGRLLWALTLVLLSFFVSEETKILKFIFKINLIVLIPLLLIYFLFVGIEAAHFPNYVLSVYKIHLDGLAYLPLFSLSIFLSNKVKGELPTFFLKGVKDVFFPILLILVAYFAFRNLGTVINSSINNNFYIFLHPDSSYDAKMHYQWGDFYRYMVFVKSNTPDNAKIIIPPELEPWLARTGDIQLVRSFLFPRELIQYRKVDIPDIKSLPEGTLIMVSWGERDCDIADCHGWPKQVIQAKKIFYKDPSSSSTIETRTNFIYEKDNYKYVYGLIEI